ncbi:YegJ family protein [Haloferula helveola]
MKLSNAFRLLVTLLLACLLQFSCEEHAGERNDEIIQVESDDEEMNEAIDTARETLDQFLEKRSGSKDEFFGLLKVYFEDEGDSEENGEHMWVSLISEENGNFTGTLLSSPGWLKSVKQGDEVGFGRSDITDWLYTEDGRAVGAYTVQLLRSRMTEEERADHDSSYPFSFE